MVSWSYWLTRVARGDFVTLIVDSQESSGEWLKQINNKQTSCSSSSIHSLTGAVNVTLASTLSP